MTHCLQVSLPLLVCRLWPTFLWCSSSALLLTCSQIHIFFRNLAGDGLSDDILEALVKVKPTDDEKKKFQKFDEDPERLRTADRFIYSLLAVPNAWLRLEAMLFKARYKEELDSAWESIETLKVGLHLY